VGASLELRGRDPSKLGVRGCRRAAGAVARGCEGAEAAENGGVATFCCVVGGGEGDGSDGMLMQIALSLAEA